MLAGLRALRAGAFNNVLACFVASCHITGPRHVIARTSWTVGTSPTTRRATFRGGHAGSKAAAVMRGDLGALTRCVGVRIGVELLVSHRLDVVSVCCKWSCIHQLQWLTRPHTVSHNHKLQIHSSQTASRLCRCMQTFSFSFAARWHTAHTPLSYAHRLCDRLLVHLLLCRVCSHTNRCRKGTCLGMSARYSKAA